MDNANSPEYLEKIKQQVFENLSRTKFAPSVQMTEVPRTPLFPNDNPDDPNNEGDAEDLDDREARLDDEDEDMNKDTRYTERRWDQRIDADGELSDSDDEEQNERNGVKRQPNGHKKRTGIMDYRNPHVPNEEGLDSGAATPIESTAGGDDADEMALDAANPPPTNGAAAAAAADVNAQVADELLAAKTEGSEPTPAQPAAGEEVASNHSERADPPPAPADVEMGGNDEPPPANAPNAPAMGGQNTIATPPESPPAPVAAADAPAAAPVTATAPVTASASEDVIMGEDNVEVAEARAEGAAERNEEDVEGEKRREGEAGGVI